MANEEMWDKLFKRVDSFKAELKPTKADASDAAILGLYWLRLGFVIAIVDHPNRARKLKDTVIEELQQRGLSPKRIQVISEELTDLCKKAEKTKQG